MLAALAADQVGLAAAGYGRIRLRGLSPEAAFRAHRAIGDAVVVIILVVSGMCVGYLGLEAEEFEAHVAVALALLCLFASKSQWSGGGGACRFCYPFWAEC